MLREAARHGLGVALAIDGEYEAALEQLEIALALGLALAGLAAPSEAEPEGAAPMTQARMART